MSAYYVSKRKEENGDFLVHKEGCPDIPVVIEWIGEYGRCTEPVSRARMKYMNVYGCPKCAEECKRT